MVLTWRKITAGRYVAELNTGEVMRLDWFEGHHASSGWYLNSPLTAHEGVHWLGDDLADAVHLASFLVPDVAAWEIDGAHHDAEMVTAPPVPPSDPWSRKLLRFLHLKP